MLDEKLIKVLDIIQEFCVEPDAYKILDADDILSKLPENVELTKSELSNAIKELKERELVKVKYFTQEEYCLSASPRAKIEQEKRQEEYKIENAIASITPNFITTKKGKNKVVSGKGSFWGSFVGAFLGGGLVVAIFEVLKLFVL